MRDLCYDDPCDRPYGPGNPDYTNDQRLDLEAEQRLALDCLMVIYKDYSGTADALAPLLGINKLWKQTKESLAQRIAALS